MNVNDFVIGTTHRSLPATVVAKFINLNTYILFNTYLHKINEKNPIKNSEAKAKKQTYHLPLLMSVFSLKANKFCRLRRRFGFGILDFFRNEHIRVIKYKLMYERGFSGACP